MILGILFFAVGAQAATLLHEDHIEPETAANDTGKVSSPGVDPASFEKSSPPEDSAPKSNPAPGRGPKSDVLVSQDQDQAARKKAARQDAALEAKKQAAEKAAAQKAEQKVIDQAEEVSDKPLNVLVLGVDHAPGGDDVTASRSDTMMLVRITPATGEVKLLSVPRDLYVEVEPGVKDKINSAYAYGGVEQATSVMEGLTGVSVDNYAIVDYEGFSEIIDVIGGVKVDVGHGVFPEKWHMGEGVQRLGGRKALFYARYRGTPRADLDRIDHQQELLAALRRQAFRWNTVTKLPGIIKTTNDNVDTDLGIWQAIPLGRALILHGREGTMSSSELQGYPTTLPEGEEVLVPEEDANEAILEDFRE